jgi:hypothetical protein
MSFPESDHLRRRRQRNPHKIEAKDIMKLPLPTIIGIIIAVLAKFIGAETDQVQSTWEGIMQLWPIWTGLLADVGSFWTTLKSSKLDKTVWRQKTFWLQILSGVTVIIGAFGIDLSGAQPLVEKVMANSEAVMALFGSLLVIIGRVRLKFVKP